MTYPFTIDDTSFNNLRAFIFKAAGIELSDEKRPLVTARLSQRLRHFGLETFQEYHTLLMSTPEEEQIAIDLLTTNETYFFREQKHFDFLKQDILPEWQARRPFRVWSAASSSGEEAYSICMLLDDVLGKRPWEVVGTDINSQVVEQASRGHYVMNRIDGIPKQYLKRYCLKGTGEYENTLLIDKSLRERVKFTRLNLLESYSSMGQFDVIFLRNVMIYFNNETKQQIVRQLANHLNPGGFLFIGLSETLKHLNTPLESVHPAIYRKPAASHQSSRVA